MEVIPELNAKQLNRFSEFLSNFSLLIIATLVLPNLFGVDKPNTNDIQSGIVLSVLFLLESLALLRNKDE